MDAYLGPAGNLIGFRASAVNITPEASASYLVTLGGRRKAQLTPQQPRSWRLNIAAATPAQLGQLSGLVQGLYGPPPWVFVEPWAAVTNLLSPAAALLKPGTWTGIGDVGGTVTLSDGSRPVHSIVDVEQFMKTLDPAPVVPGEQVTASIYGTGNPNFILSLQFRSSGGTVLSAPSTTINAPAAGNLQRGSLTATAPEGAAECRIQTTARRASLPAVTLTPQVEAWTEGNGAGKVIVEGLEKAVIIAVRDMPGLRRADVSFTIMEVGND